MTHSLHRVGTTNDLHCDYVIIVKPERGVNLEGSVSKCRELLRLFHRNGAVNITGARGKQYKGNFLESSLEQIIEAFKDGNSPYAVFDNIDNLRRAIDEIKNKDFGFSVVVSGLEDDIKDICDELGLKPHTYNHSLGIWGNNKLLPSPTVLAITTMCGHAMVSNDLVEKMVEKIKKGNISMEEASIELGKCCLCGIFNQKRAEKLLKLLVNDEELEDLKECGIKGWNGK